MNLLIATNFFKQMGGVLVFMAYTAVALSGLYLIGKISEKIWGSEKVDRASAGAINIIIAIVVMLIAVAIISGGNSDHHDSYDTDRRIGP